MPELPEVETIRRGLDGHVRGCTISEALVGRHRGFRFSYSRFKSAVKGQSINRLSRRGKYLIFELDRHYCIFHLGMTGQLTLRDPSKEDIPFDRHPITGLQRTTQHPVDKHTHLQFILDNGNLILFRDVRKFGRVRFLIQGEGVLEGFFSHLGLEPFTSAYDRENFLALMNNRKTKIKSLLLNQSFIAGIGNIYADEALFESGIHPSRRVNQLRAYEKTRLFEAIPTVLERGIRFGGTSIRDFVNSEGVGGSNQAELNVYGRQGKPCRSCNATLQKIVLGQRGTHYCPVCQPRYGSSRGPNRKES